MGCFLKQIVLQIFESLPPCYKVDYILGYTDQEHGARQTPLPAFLYSFNLLSRIQRSSSLHVHYPTSSMTAAAMPLYCVHTIVIVFVFSCFVFGKMNAAKKENTLSNSLQLFPSRVPCSPVHIYTQSVPFYPFSFWKVYASF